MRKCAPGGGEALNWSQNSGGWSRTSHPPSVPRGENTRSLARVASSSRRMPAINPSKPYLASASFNPSVLRAADRAAGGKVDRWSPAAGRVDLEIELPFLAVAIAKRVHLGELLAGIDCRRGTAPGRRTPCAPARSSRWNPCRATTAAPAFSAARRPRGKCRCSAPQARRGGPSSGIARASAGICVHPPSGRGNQGNRSVAGSLSRTCISRPWSLEAKIL